MKKKIKFLLQTLFPNSFLFGRIPQVEGLLLTFDDGPHPEHTPIICEHLGKRGIKGIFFVVGEELEKYPEQARALVRDGHILANHTHEHLDIKKVHIKAYINSLQKTDQRITNFMAKPIRKIFRPPYGHLSFLLLFYTLLSRSLLLNWSADSKDSFIRDPNALYKHIKKLPLQHGDILLFHEDYLHTVQALPLILDLLEERGFNFLDPTQIFYDQKQRYE